MTLAEYVVWIHILNSESMAQIRTTIAETQTFFYKGLFFIGAPYRYVVSYRIVSYRILGWPIAKVGQNTLIKTLRLHVVRQWVYFCWSFVRFAPFSFFGIAGSLEPMKVGDRLHWNPCRYQSGSTHSLLRLRPVPRCFITYTLPYIHHAVLRYRPVDPRRRRWRPSMSHLDPGAIGRRRAPSPSVPQTTDRATIPG